MKWQANYTHPEGLLFVIEHEHALVMTNQGPAEKDFFYLIGTDPEGHDFCNYMQEELEAATQQAARKWGVPEDSWVKAEE